MELNVSGSLWKDNLNCEVFCEELIKVLNESVVKDVSRVLLSFLE
jgi:hypothetical protein